MLKVKTTEEFANSKFGYEYVRILAPLAGKHMEIFLDAIRNRVADNLDYNLIGTANEITLKKISNYYGLLHTVFEDLGLVLSFLRVKERSKLYELFPELENDEQYYVYHLENYIIRISTVSDLVGKLGNILYKTGIDEEKCNGYKFKDAISKIDSSKTAIIEKLLIRTKEIKDIRHKKIHTGESELPYLTGIVFYSDLMKLINEKASPILDEYTDNNLIDEIDKIEIEIFEIISIVNDFLDASIDKLKDLVKEE